MLRDFQSMLSRLYGIEQSLDVRDFLLTDARLLAELEGNGDARPAPEKVLVHESAGELGITLYLDAELLERLTSTDPRRRLTRANLADFWTVLEGVSHFNYITWNAAADKSITLLEVEMQAEVDKYVSALLLLGQQSNSGLIESLFGRLFDDPTFDANLGPRELSRYRAASLYAGRFCHSLEQRFPAASFAPAMLTELRAFFRQSQPEKVGHIQSALFA
jgi:hypothetical protein